MSDNENPALPEIVEERDRTIIRFGKTEIVQTADFIRIQAWCKNHLDFDVADDLRRRVGTY